MKIDDPYNYAVYNHLQQAVIKTYKLRSVSTGYITNVGDYERQYSYTDTEFYNYDQFLFATWRDKPKGKGKDEIPWGVDVI